MKNTFILSMLMAVLGLSSCSLARFEHVPGDPVPSMPEELIGRYEFKTPVTGMDSAVFEVDKTGIRSTMKGKPVIMYQLGMDFTVARLGRYVIIGKKDIDFKDLWNLAVVEYKKTSIDVYPIVRPVLERTDDPIMAAFELKMLMLNHNGIERSAPPKPVTDRAGNVISPPPGPPATQDVVQYFAFPEDKSMTTYIETQLKSRTPMTLVPLKTKKK
jgi:hypothetical protein